MSSNRTSNVEQTYDNSDVAIRVQNLGKCYQIYERPQDRLKQSIMPRLHSLALPLKRALGREASNSPSYCREFWALKDVSFQVKRGETAGVIGRNGSGKSTLLQLICGTLTPTSGAVDSHGRVAALLELGAGFNPEFTGRENVYMNGTVLGLSREQIGQRFDAIAAFADIGEFIEQPVKTYSSGMFMRLAFAVIAHVDADILVIDEALSVGDAFFVQKCMRFLRNFQKRGTVLFVSHDTGAVTNLCGQAIWLDHGVIRAVGNAKDVCEQYFAAVYAEDMGMKAVRGATPLKKGVSLAERDSKQTKARTNDGNESKMPKGEQKIEIFGFNLDSADFGTGQATLVSVELVDASTGEPLTWISGGEDVEIILRAVCDTDLDCPIMGFHVKDRLGQPLFGDNTYPTYQDNPLFVKAGSILQARFEFGLPLLRSGDYSICAAIASGTIQSHVQHHWLHDAMLFTVHSSSLTGVLVGIPMKSVVMNRIPCDEENVIYNHTDQNSSS